MARKKTPPDDTAELENTDDALPFDAEDGEDGEQDVEQYFNELGDSETKVEIREITPEGIAFVGSIALPLFNMEYLTERCGPGKYQLRLRRAGRWVKNATRTVQIARSARALVDAEKGETAGAAGDKGIMLLMTYLLETNKTMMGALTAQRGTAGSPESGAVLELLKELVLRQPEREQSPDSIVDVFREALEMGRSLGESAGGDTNSLLAMRALDMLKGMRLDGHPAASTPPPTPESPAMTAEMNTPSWFQPILPYLSFLLPRARANADPRAYADMVLSELPDSALPAIEECIQHLLNPGGVDALARGVPQIGQHAGWFARLAAEIRSTLATDDVDVEVLEPDTPTPPAA